MVGKICINEYDSLAHDLKLKVSIKPNESAECDLYMLELNVYIHYASYQKHVAIFQQEISTTIYLNYDI